MRVYVDNVGLVGPGLAGWAAAREVLRGVAAYTRSELALPRLDLLPAAERRRTGVPVKLALAAGLDALTGASRPAGDLPSVFTSSGADGQVLHEICETLVGPDRQVSPTRFHNSVHNAAAGYWSIATQSHAPSTSLCAYDWSFAAGLLESAAQVLAEHAAVLLVSFDQPYCEPLHSTRVIDDSLGVALLLAREAGIASLAQIELRLAEPTSPTPMRDPGLERLRSGNPSGRALPLLAALAGRSHSVVALDYLLDRSMLLEITPC